MFGQLFKGFQFLHVAILVLGAIGFFLFWARTRFWLPKYAHVLAAIGLAVGVWCAFILPSDAPINKQGPMGRLLLALALPAMVYFFFVFYGGQRASFGRRPKTAAEIADLIERFLNDTRLYPEEWTDYVGSSQPDRMMDAYRKRCAELSPLVNSLGPQDTNAVTELRRMVDELRSLSTPA